MSTTYEASQSREVGTSTASAGRAGAAAGGGGGGLLLSSMALEDPKPADGAEAFLAAYVASINPSGSQASSLAPVKDKTVQKYCDEMQKRYEALVADAEWAPKLPRGADFLQWMVHEDVCGAVFLPPIVGRDLERAYARLRFAADGEVFRLGPPDLVECLAAFRSAARPEGDVVTGLRVLSANTLRALTSVVKARYQALTGPRQEHLGVRRGAAFVDWILDNGAAFTEGGVGSAKLAYERLLRAQGYVEADLGRRPRRASESPRSSNEVTSDAAASAQLVDVSASASKRSSEARRYSDGQSEGLEAPPPPGRKGVRSSIPSESDDDSASETSSSPHHAECTRLSETEDGAAQEISAYATSWEKAGREKKRGTIHELCAALESPIKRPRLQAATGSMAQSSGAGSDNKMAAESTGCAAADEDADAASEAVSDNRDEEDLDDGEEPVEILAEAEQDPVGPLPRTQRRRQNSARGSRAGARHRRSSLPATKVEAELETCLAAFEEQILQDGVSDRGLRSLTEVTLNRYVAAVAMRYRLLTSPERPRPAPVGEAFLDWLVLHPNVFSPAGSSQHVRGACRRLLRARNVEEPPLEAETQQRDAFEEAATTLQWLSASGAGALTPRATTTSAVAVQDASQHRQERVAVASSASFIDPEVGYGEPQAWQSRPPLRDLDGWRGGSPGGGCIGGATGPPWITGPGPTAHCMSWSEAPPRLAPRLAHAGASTDSEGSSQDALVRSGPRLLPSTHLPMRATPGMLYDALHAVVAKREDVRAMRSRKQDVERELQILQAQRRALEQQRSMWNNALEAGETMCCALEEDYRALERLAEEQAASRMTWAARY